MLHWPDNMFTYAVEDKVLFSSDAFGQHYAGPERFDDEIGDEIMKHAKKYFANILMLYAKKTKKTIDAVTELGLEFDVICPDHGIIWRKNPGAIIEKYLEWGEQKAKKKAIVVYDTMWHSTEVMAEAICQGLAELNIEAKPIHLRKWHRSDIMVDVMDAKAIIVGSPTLNNNIYPTVIDFLTYLKGLKPKNKIGAAFGSYGWSGESIKQINIEFEKMKFEILDSISQGLKLQYVPDKNGIDECINFGRIIGEAINK